MSGPGALPDLFAPQGESALLEGLNPEQGEAVTHGEGPLLILAGPGTGKTHVITRRIAWLITTKRARSRGDPRPDVHRQGGRRDGGPRRRAGALRLHGRNALDIPRLLRPAGARTRGRTGPHVAATRRAAAPRSWCSCASDCSTWVSRATCRSASPTPTSRRWSTCSIGRATRTSRPEQYLAFAEDLAARAGDDAELRDRADAELEKAHAYAAYQRAARRARPRRLRVADQSRAATVARAAARAPAGAQDRFRWILVDEFQDTNHVQFELVRLLAGARRNLTVVGDDDQSIYRFRGAKVENLLGFSSAFPERAVVLLRRNYRSRPADPRPRPPRDPVQQPACGSRRATRRSTTSN